MKCSLVLCCLLLVLAQWGVAPAAIAQQRAAQSKDDDSRLSYVLGQDDQVAIRGIDPEETTEKPVRIDMNGYIRLPLVGRVKAAGLTAEQLEKSLDEALKAYLVEPDVSVFIVDFRSQPASVVGAVKTPGVIQLQGHKTLIEVLSLAGGLTEDSGHSIKITRRLEEGRIPLPDATDDSTGAFSVAEVSLKDLMEARNPAANILIRPQDVISVPRGEMIYVVGQVQHAGGFVLREKQSLSVLQALAVAGGMDKGAAPKNARILRAAQGDAKRKEIPVDLRKILDGRSEDLALKQDDILFVPASRPKQAFTKGIEAAIAVGTGLAIYRM